MRTLLGLSSAIILTGNALFAECCSYLPPNRPCLLSDLPDQSNVYTQISFLYWECGERGLDYALKNKSSQSNENLSIYKPDFKWDPALRLCLGYHLPHDHWMVDLTYAIFYQHLYDHIDDSASQFGQGILSVWTSPGAFLSENLFARWRGARAKWKLHAHFFDLMLRHNLWNGNALSFQPSIGVKLALLQQRYVTSYYPGNTIPFDETSETLLASTINMNNRSLNIGPTVGCSSKWCLDPHWNVFGSLSGALLGAHFHVGRNEYDTSLTTETIIGSYRTSDEYWTYRPQGSVLFGIQWGDCSCSKRKVIHYALSASYEAQYWWKQNMLLRHYDAPAPQSQTMGPVQGDLFFQGLTIDLLIDF